MNKSSKHWYPRYSGDYRAKTAGLSLIQHGAYTLLLDEYYNTEKPLPANASVLHRICSALAQDEKDAIDFILVNFFTKTDDGYKNKRVEEELAKRVDISDKRKKAANLRHAKDMQTPCKIDANAPAIAYTSTSTSTSTSTPKSKTTKDQEDLLNLKNDFNVDNFLTDIDRMCIKSEAPAWDLHGLIITFNAWVKKNQIPKNPSAAFLAWTIKFTKGKSP